MRTESVPEESVPDIPLDANKGQVRLKIQVVEIDLFWVFKNMNSADCITEKFFISYCSQNLYLEVEMRVQL